MYHLVSFIVRSVGSNCGCVVPSHTQTRPQTVPIDSRTVSEFPNCVHVTHAYVRIYFAPVAATVLQQYTHCKDRHASEGLAPVILTAAQVCAPQPPLNSMS